MRLLLCLLLLLSGQLFAQKSPVGLIVKFYDEVNIDQKADLINRFQEFNSLKEEHVLKGFDITLVEGAETLEVSDYRHLQDELEESDFVEYTSILYKTEKGAIGGDLQKLYIKPKQGFDMVDYYHFGIEHGFRLTYDHHYLEGVYVSEINKYSADIRSIQDELMATGNFEFVSVNTFHSVLATIDDPYFENQWALENEGTALHYDGTPGADMQIPDAWSVTTGSPDIKIAVLDSGTDTNHVDLVGNLLPGYDATGGGSLGYPNTTYSNDAHGTCTAGIISAIGDNGEGIVGIAYTSKVIPVKIFYYIEFGGDVIPFTSGEAGTNGIIWAVQEANADIVSNSWGLRSTDIELLGIDTAVSNMIIKENIEDGRGGLGTPMLFSSGNEYDPWSIWPASHPMTISVGASSMCDELKAPTDCSPEGWWGSNHGDNLDVTAPGVKVLATDMTGSLGYNGFADNNYSMFNGTSAACPNAAGVMALILSVDPTLTAFDARAVLSVTAEKVGGYDYDTPGDFGMWSEEMGYGRVNGFEAVYYANYNVGLDADERSLHFIKYGNGETILFLGNNAPATVTIYSVTGEKITNFNTLGSQINLDDYVSSTGLYLLEVVQGGEQSVLKAIIK